MNLLELDTHSSFAPRAHVWAGTLAASLLCLSACGGGTANGGNPPGAGETTIETWSDYCIATFTEDYAVTDAFDEVAFTARVGEEYVISDFDGISGPELVYLAETGPWSFTVTASAGALPFTSNCQAGSTTEHLAVFSDVTVYAEEELTTPICELAAGTAHPRNPTVGAGHSWAGSTADGNLTYEVILNSFSADCGGAALGYVSVPQTTVHGTTTALVPILWIVGPA